MTATATQPDLILVVDEEGERVEKLAQFEQDNREDAWVLESLADVRMLRPVKLGGGAVPECGIYPIPPLARHGQFFSARCGGYLAAYYPIEGDIIVFDLRADHSFSTRTYNLIEMPQPELRAIARAIVMWRASRAA